MWAIGGKDAGFAADNAGVIRTTAPENIATFDVLPDLTIHGSVRE
jgi:hypothetical protein